MNNDELDQRLRSASPPDRSEAYWREFPESVERRILSEEQRAKAVVRPGFHPSLKWIWRLALPGAAVAIALLLIPGQQSKTPIDEQLSSLRAGYDEVAELFPGQLETVVFGGDEPYLQLSDLPDVPSSPTPGGVEGQTLVNWPQQSRHLSSISPVFAPGSGQLSGLPAS